MDSPRSPSATVLKRGTATAVCGCKKTRSSPLEALELLLGDSEHFGPAKVESLEGRVADQQRRIQELEGRLAAAETEAQTLRVARDTMQEELSKRPPSPTSPEQPDTAQTLTPPFFHARMHSPGSASSLDALAMDEPTSDDDATPTASPSVDELTALLAEKAALQQLVRKIANDLEAERAENRRGQAKREHFERELAELVALSKPATPRSLDTALTDSEPLPEQPPKDEEVILLLQEQEAADARQAAARTSRFSLRNLCRSLARRPDAALVDKNTAAAA